MLKMSGRIYNAMMKFAGGTKTHPQFANMFFFNGKIYATNSIAMCRWTPATKYVETTSEDKEVTNAFYFTPRMSKVPAGTTIYIDSTMLDIDKESVMLNDPDKVMDGTYKHPLDVISGINPDYLAAIAALGKAVRTDKNGSNGTVDIDWESHTLHAHIDAGDNGFFDVVVMPILNRKQLGYKI